MQIKILNSEITGNPSNWLKARYTCTYIDNLMLLIESQLEVIKGYEGVGGD